MGAEDLIQRSKALAALSEELSFIRWLTTTFPPAPLGGWGRSNVLFWLLQALAHVRQAHAAPHIDINKDNYLLKYVRMELDSVDTERLTHSVGWSGGRDSEVPRGLDLPGPEASFRPGKDRVDARPALLQSVDFVLFPWGLS